MHICLDFIPELIAQPELEKQVLCSHLAGESLWVLALMKYWLRGGNKTVTKNVLF